MTMPAVREVLDVHHALGRLDGTAALAVNGEVVATWAAGQARPGVDLTTETRLPIGSLTKAVTAAGVLALVADGKLALDAPIGDYLPAGLVAWADTVTVRHCLAHTAGIPSLFKAHPGIPPATTAQVTSTIPVEDLVAHFAGLPLRFAAGSAFEYSNSGYVLLALAIEHASGEPFHRFLSRAIFEPIGVPRIGVVEVDALEVLPRFGAHAAPVLHPSWQLGAGDLAASAPDLARLHARLSSVLPADALALMTQPSTPSYGFGWRLGTRAGHRVAWHEGVLPGMVATIHRALDADVVAVVMTPRVPSAAHTTFVRSWLNRVADQLVAIGRGSSPIDAPEVPRPFTRRELGELPGRYEVDTGRALVIEAVGDQLHARAEGPWLIQGVLADLEPEEQRVAHAGTLACHALRDRAWDRLHALCSSVVRSIETPRSLANAWEPTLSHLGALEEATLVLVSGPVACLRVRFQSGAVLDLRVSTDEDGRSVAGLYVVAVGDLPAVCAQTIRAAGDRFYSDGFTGGVPDAWLEINQRTRTAVVRRKHC